MGNTTVTNPIPRPPLNSLRTNHVGINPKQSSSKQNSPHVSLTNLKVNEFMSNTNSLNKLSRHKSSKINNDQYNYHHRTVPFKAYIAIDFGTDGCALAFAYNGTVTVYNKWKTTTRSTVKKAKTQILCDDKNNVVAFGDAAKKMYSNLIGAEKRTWKFFERFKMSLLSDNQLKNNNINELKTNHHNKVEISSELTAINGSKCPAENIFVKAFSDLKQMAIEYLYKLCKQYIDDNEIQWIITVPAIWSDSAKLKMRNWAIKAKLSDTNHRNQLRIVCEPDCAALAIREMYHNEEHYPTDDEKKSEYINTIIKGRIDSVSMTNLFPIHNFRAQNRLNEAAMKQIRETKVYNSNLTKLNVLSFWEKINRTLTDPEIVSSHTSDIISIDIMERHRRESCADKYILIDAGGGTVDVVCHEIRSGQSIQEICYPSGGAWGSCYIDDMFKTLMNSLFSKKWMDEWMNLFPNIYMEIIDNFQIAKCVFYEDINAKLHDIELPYEFVQFLQEKCMKENVDLQQKFKDISIDKSIKDLFLHDINFTGKKDEYMIRLDDEFLSIDVKIWKHMFDSVLNKVIEHVSELLHDLMGNTCKYLYLVGGFSCSPYFQCRMKTEFGDKLEVIIPDNPTMIVVIGAAYFGIRKNYITGRKSRFTYGIRVMRTVDDAEKYDIDNVHLVSQCDIIPNCFHIMTHKNELIHMDDSRQITVKSDFKKSLLAILKSDKESPKFESDGIVIQNDQIEYDENGEAVVDFHFGDMTFVVYTYFANTPHKKRMLKEIDY